ncbi:MAG: hypothetical protein FWF08_08390 [Oscillospiraceae bacterium]|nr:hypothetical protein [Oscillospiraceae bacterium]
MTKIKEQAVEILQDIPDEVVIYIMRILKDMQSFYAKNGGSVNPNANSLEQESSFPYFAVVTTGYVFNREEANER